MEYITHVLIAMAISGILVVSLNLAVGITGLVHLGHLAVAGVGAYTSALLLTTLHIPFPLALLSAAMAGAFVGWCIGLPTRDIHGEAFALATFSAAWVYLVAALSWGSLTGGPLGVVGVPRPAIATKDPEFFLLTAVVLIVTYAALTRVVASPFGRVLAAIRDDELAARVFGKRTIAAKRAALAVSGSIAAVGGALTASFIQFLHPTMFWLPALLTAVSALILGGVGNLAGSLAGVVVLSVINEAVRFTPIAPEHLGAIRLIIAASVLLLILLVRPRGLFGKVDVT